MPDANKKKKVGDGYRVILFGRDASEGLASACLGILASLDTNLVWPRDANGKYMRRKKEEEGKSISAPYPKEKMYLDAFASGGLAFACLGILAALDTNLVLTARRERQRYIKIVWQQWIRRIPSLALNLFLDAFASGGSLFASLGILAAHDIVFTIPRDAFFKGSGK